jgi:hypothetical protein
MEVKRYKESTVQCASKGIVDNAEIILEKNAREKDVGVDLGKSTDMRMHH